MGLGNHCKYDSAKPTQKADALVKTKSANNFLQLFALSISAGYKGQLSNQLAFDLRQILDFKTKLDDC